MTLEYLEKQKNKYQNKTHYFSAIGFDNLANNFQDMVDLINEMEKHINENDDQPTLESSCEEEKL
jgi:hypothetical protein